MFFSSNESPIEEEAILELLNNLLEPFHSIHLLTNEEMSLA